MVAGDEAGASKERRFAIFVLVCFLNTSYRGAAADEYDRAEWGIYEDLFANLTYKNDTYNWRTRPGIYSGTPLIVNTSLYLYSMTSVNELHTEYTIQMLYRQSWIDPRLKFPDDFPASKIVGDHWHFKRIWTPSVHVVNNKESTSLSIVSDGTVLVHIYRDGRVLTSNRIHMRPLCRMEFHRYPLDKQTCSFEIESSTLAPNHMRLQWAEEKPITLSENFYLNGYYLINFSTEAVTSLYWRTGNFSKVIAQFQFQREFGHFLFDIYVPGILFVVTSWTSFWVEIPAAPARVTLGITTMLTLITSEKSVREKLPKVSYVHALDIWNVVCTGFIFASLLEYAMVNYIYHKDKRKRQGGMKRVDSAATFSSLDTAMYSTFTSNALSSLKTVFKREDQKQQSPEACVAATFQDLEAGANHPSIASISLDCGPWMKESLRPQDIANGIDRKCRIIFPLGFILFNVVYWTVLWV